MGQAPDQINTTLHCVPGNKMHYYLHWVTIFMRRQRGR